jgi:hypothetical protein
MRMLLLAWFWFVVGCAGAVGPVDAGDAVEVRHDVTQLGDSDAGADVDASLECVNSITCPTNLACLQGHCSTPCAVYDTGCEQ